MTHRGPDGSGIWYDDFTILGHRRLTIIDLFQMLPPNHLRIKINLLLHTMVRFITISKLGTN